MRSVLRFFSCTWMPAAPAPFVEETIFASLNSLCSLVQVSYKFVWVYSWALCSVLSCSVDLHLPHQHRTVRALSLRGRSASGSIYPPTLFSFRTVLASRLFLRTVFFSSSLTVSQCQGPSEVFGGLADIAPSWVAVWGEEVCSHSCVGMCVCVPCGDLPLAEGNSPGAPTSPREFSHHVAALPLTLSRPVFLRATESLINIYLFWPKGSFGK